MTDFLRFLIPSHKRTISFYGKKLFLKFPDMEFMIPYETQLNTNSPHFKLFYIYKNKRYIPNLSNKTNKKDGLYFCANQKLYGKIKKHKNLKSMKNFFVESFFNTYFDYYDYMETWAKVDVVDQKLIKLISENENELPWYQSKLHQNTLKSVEDIPISNVFEG